MAHGWDSYFHNIPPVSSDPRTLRRTSETEGSLSQHIENFTGHHDFLGTVASHEAPATNSNFNTNYYTHNNIGNSSSDYVYQRYYMETPWQTDGEEMEKDYLPKCETSAISDFATDGLTSSGSFPMDLQGLKQDCGMLATSFIEDYSDVSSCSDADVGETRPSCKFMTTNSVPKPITDVGTKHSLSDWLFTHTGNMCPTESLCPDISDTNVILPRPSNGEARENIVECSQDKIGSLEKACKSYTGHDQSCTTASMVTTTGSETAEDRNYSDGCQKQKEDVETDLAQVEHSFIMINSDENLIDDRKEEYPDGSNKEQIIAAAPNIIATFDNEQDHFEEKVSTKENMAFDNVNPTHSQDRIMREDEQDANAVLKMDGKESASLEDKIFDEQKSLNANSSDQDENMEFNYQEKDITSQSSDPLSIKVSDFKDANQELRECTSTLKNSHESDSCLQLLEHQSYKSLTQDNNCRSPTVMFDGHLSNASDSSEQSVASHAESCSQPNGSVTDPTPCLKQDGTSTGMKTNTISSTDPDCSGSSVTSDSLSIDTSDKSEQSVADHPEFDLKTTRSNTYTNPCLEEELTDPGEWTSATLFTDPEGSGPAVSSDNTEQRVYSHEDFSLQANDSTADLNPCLEMGWASTKKKTNTTSSTVPDSNGFDGSLSNETSDNNEQSDAEHLELNLQTDSSSTDIPCLEKEMTRSPKMTTTSSTDSDCSGSAVTSDSLCNETSKKNEQNVSDCLEFGLQTDGSNTDTNLCGVKEMTSPPEKKTSSTDPDCAGPGVTRGSHSVDLSDNNKQSVVSYLESCLQSDGSTTNKLLCVENEMTSPAKKTNTSSLIDPEFSSPAVTSDPNVQSVPNTLESCLQSNAPTTDTNSCLQTKRPTDNANATLSSDQQQSLQNRLALEAEGLGGDIAENARQSFEKLDTSKQGQSVPGILYGEPLSAEDSSCDTDDTVPGTGLYKEMSVDMPDSNSTDNSKAQEPQLESSRQLGKHLHPVVMLNTLEPVNRISKLYRCAECQQTTHNVDHLIEHHYCCHSVHDFQYCMTCNLYVMRNEQAEKHLCGVIKESPQVFSDCSPQKEKKRHSCVRCGIKFPKLIQYISHMRGHTGKTPYKCNKCGLYFAQHCSLSRHKHIPGRCKLAKHPVTNYDAVTSETKTPPKKDLVQDKPYVNLPECYIKLVDFTKTNMCRLCGKSFSTVDETQKHFYNAHKGKGLSVSLNQGSTNISGKETPKAERETRGKYNCPLCPRFFKYSYNRARHLRDCVKESIYGGKKTVDGKYWCPLCHTTFTLPSNRYRHIQTICLKECLNRLAKERAKTRQDTEQLKIKDTEQKTQFKSVGEQKKQPKENEQKKQAPPAITAPKTFPRYKCNLCPAVFSHASGKYRHMKKHELFKLTGKMFRYRNSVFTAMCKPATLSSMENEKIKENLKPAEANSSLALSCRFCEKGFSTSQSLKKHESSHRGERPYCCLECGKRFKKRSGLIGHKIVHQRRIQCTVCRKILPTIGELIQHRKSHLKRGKLQCPDCHLQFQYPAYLLRHLNSHRNRENKAPHLEESPALKPHQPLESVKEHSKPKQLHCSLCKDVFNDAQVLRKHCFTHISESSSNQCPFCKLTFRIRRNLLRHMIKHTGDKPFSCENCGKQFYRDCYLKFHSQRCSHAHTRHLVTMDAKMKTTTQYQCSYCPRKLTKKRDLKGHHRAHKRNTLLLCSRCGQYFGFTKLNQHQRNCVGTVELNTGSPDGNFSKRTSLTNQNVHKISLQSSATKKLQLNCPHCTQKFRYRSLLLRHLVSHTGVQPYACMHCGHRYGSQTMCLQHEAFCDGVYKEEPLKVKSDAAAKLSNMPTHAEAAQKPQVEGDAEYKCKFCTKTFMKSRNLRHHILTHNEVKPYRCKGCDSCFSRYDHLKVHQTRCKGKRRRLEVCIPKISLDDVGKGWQTKCGIAPAKKPETFECEVCSRSFPTKSKLSRHNTLFHTAKLFKCTHCGSSFAHEKSLKKHRKRTKCKKASGETSVSVPLETYQSTENVPKPLYGVKNQILQRIKPCFNKKYKYVCSYCPRAFGTAWQLGIHTRLHTGEKPFSCDYCGERFIRKDYVQRHHPKCPKKEQQNNILCDKCGEVISKVHLENHKKNCTLPQISSKSTVCQSQQSASQIPPKGFSCAYCSSRFLLFSKLQEHFLNAHKLETTVPPVTTAPLQHHLSNVPDIKEEPSEESCDERRREDANLICELDTALDHEVHKQFYCQECNLFFASKPGLTSHLRGHAMESPFNCKLCHKGFWNKTLVRNHYRKCRFGHTSEGNTVRQEAPLKAEIDFALNDSVLVFKEHSKTTGTGVLQTNFSCKDDFMGESAPNSEGTQVQSSSNVKKVVQYQCSECDKSFTDGLLLISHLEDHGRQEQEKKCKTCTKCGRVCDTREQLERHMRLHGIIKEYPCPDCPKVFYILSDLKIHKTCHDSNRPYACKLCTQRFWTRPSLYNHYMEDHPADTFTCHFCNNSYSTKNSLARHYKKWHQKEQKEFESMVQEKSSTEQQTTSHVSTTGESDTDENSSEDSDSDSAPYFPCHVCGKTFPTSESLEDHQRCHLGEKPHECEECGRCFFQASQLQQHQRMHQSEFQCQACGRGFVSLFALRKHKHTHGKSRPYRCTKCDFSFTGPLQLAEHMSTHREENFPCDICSHVFLSKASRAEHRKSHSQSVDQPPPSVSREEHEKSSSVSDDSSAFTNELKYRCGVCNERFRDPEELSEHGCAAANERLYSCSDCNKHFLHASHLKKHRTTHQLSSSVSEYPCNQCNSSFASPQHFLSHLKTHVDTAAEIKGNIEGEDGGPSQGFICPVCHQCFASAAELSCHFPTHSDGIFKCKICKKTFSSPSKLEEHACHHLTFECTECGQWILGSDAFHQHCYFHQKQKVIETKCSNPSAKASPPTRYQAAGEEEEIDVIGEDLFNCSVCSMQFFSKSGLLEHQNKQHLNDKPFRCELCGKKFALRRYLRRHEQRHRLKSVQSSENEFRCNQCHTKFNTAKDLSLHMKRHAEKNVGEYRCDMCYKSFSHWSLLKQHQESHVGQVVYECTECDKAFAFPHLLEEHQQSHAGSSQ